VGATYRLPKEMRPHLARPLGKLYLAAELGERAFARLVKAAPVVVTVGDRVTETLGSMGRVPDVQIVDSRENRLPRTAPDVPHSRTIRVQNPPGAVTRDAMLGIKAAFEGRWPARVLVEGEEDLLTLPAVVFAPLSAVVFYGQPGAGIVAVKVTVASKRRNADHLARMGAVHVGQD